MTKPRISAGWLSFEMARALAATGPPLKPRDVVRAADEVALHTAPAQVVSHLLRHGPDLVSARTIVAALRALRDFDVGPVQAAPERVVCRPS
jgi:hypothetical protein